MTAFLNPTDKQAAYKSTFSGNWTNQLASFSFGHLLQKQHEWLQKSQRAAVRLSRVVASRELQIQALAYPHFVSMRGAA